MVVFGASDGAVPFIMKYMLDGVFVKQDRNLLYLLPVALVVFSIIRSLVDFGQQYLMAKVGNSIVHDIRRAFNDHILKLSPDYFVSNSSAQLISRVTSDVLLVRGLLTDCAAALIRDSIRVVALLAAAIYLDPFLALIAFVVVPVGVFPVYRFGRKIRKLSKRGQDAIGSLSAMMQESILGNRVVKIFAGERFEKERFDRENERLNLTFIKTEKVRALIGPVNEIMATLAIAGIVMYGGFSVIGGTRSQGDFIAFIISVFLMYDPFKKLSRLHSVIQQGIAGVDRIFEVLDAEPSIVDPPAPLPIPTRHDIDFTNVSFAYGRNDQSALQNINLQIKEGEKVALVGFSGAGKSTLVDLVPRFIDPASGTVKISGVDISKVKLSDLRSRIALVGQHTFLFNDSIYNNILYGLQTASRDEVYEAARAAYAFDFIMQMPKGFDTVIGEAGLSLSGGERQRIAIARAILKNAPILILDEATASLDNKAEREVQSAIEALQKGRTSLIIAHRLSTVRNVDRIVVLREGYIVEIGTHDELLAKQGEYSRLYDLQFESKDDKAEVDEALIN
jgi:subfamily B ATP-binding cassette protein MsbA